jgi:WS/DGAT/MGAT family acyltransferase
MPEVRIADRLFLAAESPQTPQHVAALGIFRAPKGAGEEFVSRLASGLRRVAEFAPPFNYRLAHPRLKAIAPSWTVLDDADIDLDFHFRRNALPRPAGEWELDQLISRLHSRPLDPARPLWELHLIEGLEGNRFALYFKVHHSLMDGLGGVQRFTRMVTSDPDDQELRPIWAIGPRRRPRTNGTASALRGAASSASGAARLTVGLAAVSLRTTREAVRPTSDARALPFAAPRSIINGRIGRQRRTATLTLDFNRIRALATAADVTVNDVLLAICAGGLRRYLKELGELPDRSLSAGTPVSVRAGGDQDSANAFTMTVMRLRTDLPDPLARLAAIHQSSTLAKRDLARLDKAVIENQAALFMGPFIAQQFTPLAGHLAPPYSVSISNVPGPSEPQYLAGARLESLAPLALIYHGVALFIAAFTISGTFTLGFVGDGDLLPHLQRLAVYTGEEVEELEAALPGTERPGLARRGNRPGSPS